MASAINFSKTHRILLLIDLTPLLQLSPNPNYINSILTTSKILLSFDPLNSSLFSFKFFFSSLSPLVTASTLHHMLPNHRSASLSFNSPSQTLDSLSNTLRSISSSQLTSSSASNCSNCAHTVAALLQIARDYDWESDIGNVSGKLQHDVVNVSSNLVIMLSPVSKSLISFMSENEDCLMNLDGYRDKFRDCFGAVSEEFNGKDIHFCWIDVNENCDKDCEISEISEVIGNEVRKFGWGFCSIDLIVLGSALVGFGLVYPNIVVSSKLDDKNHMISGQLSLEILDVSGKPLECKLCDIELLPLKVKNFYCGLKEGIVKVHVTEVQKYTEFECCEEICSEVFVVRSVESGKKGKDGGLDSVFADRVLALLAGERFELFEKKTVPTWQIFLSFLYREGYWAKVSLSNGNGDSYIGMLKPFTVHSAVLLLSDSNRSSVQNSVETKLLINGKFPQGDTDFQKGTCSLGKHVHLVDGKRRKMKKHAYLDLTWSSFCKAAYEFSDVDLAEVYFANGLKRSKKLKFLKCWMKEVKKQVLCLNNTPHGQCQKGPDSNQQKETNISDELLSMRICSDQSGMQDDTGAALVSCSETVESFFTNLPHKIQHGLESFGVDLKILAERLVHSSIYWLRLKHEAMESVDEVAEIIKLLLREPKDLKEHKDDNPGSTTEHLVREYELQILLRLEILQSEYAGSIKGYVKSKLVKQICALLEIVQYLVGGGFHGDVSLYDYVERTIKRRYSENLGDVVDKIYDQMDLLPFGEENEDQALMFNSEDSNQSWKGQHERNDMSASKTIQDSLSIENESFEKVNTGQTKEDDERKLNEARERRERARRFVSFTSRMPDLQRVWAPKQSKSIKVKPEPQRKKCKRVSYSVVCETPLIGNEGSCGSQGNKGERSNPVSKALFQDDN